MGKSLGDYNIEQSSSFDLKNIKWTQKNQSNIKKPKQSRNHNPPPLSPIIIHKTLKDKSSNKLFIVESLVTDNQKNKKSAVKKRFQNSSATMSKIEQGFKRPGR